MRSAGDRRVLEGRNLISCVKVCDFGLLVDFFEISWKMLVLEIWSIVFCMHLVKNAHSNFNFRECLAEFSRFGASIFANACSFWKSGSSVFEEVLQKTILFEVFICGASLTEIARFGMGMLPRTPHQERYRSHRFKNVTALTASRTLPQSPLKESYRNHRRECYQGHRDDRSHRFKNVTVVSVSSMITAVTASRMRPPSPASHRFKNVTSPKIFFRHLSLSM